MPAIRKLDFTKDETHAAFIRLRGGLDGFHAAVQTATLWHNDFAAGTDGIRQSRDNIVAGLRRLRFHGRFEPRFYVRARGNESRLAEHKKQK